METVIVQIGGACNKYRLSDEPGARLRIGRSFSSDIIITDPYVGPSQLVLKYSPDDESSWRISNVDSSNPVLLNRKVIETEDFEIISGDEVTIGRTRVVFYKEDHDVPKVREFSFTNWLHNHKYKPLFASIMLLILFCIALWAAYSESTSEVNWGKLSVSALLPVGFAFIWASGWSFAGRILKSDHYFFSHLFFTAFSFSLFMLLGNIDSYFDYIFSSVLTGEIVDWFMTILITGLLIGLNLALVTYSPGAFKKGLISSVCLFGIIAVLLYLYEDEYDNKPAHSYTVKPSYIPTPEAEKLEKYIENYDVLFEKLSSLD